MDRLITSNPSTSEITHFLCEALELANGVRELNTLYKDDTSSLIGELRSSAYLEDPRFVKVQLKYNSLQEKVTNWTNPEDPRFAQVFSKICEPYCTSILQTEIEELIGKENIIDSGYFKKFGIICLKDTAIPNPKPENVVTEKELQKMLNVRKNLISESSFNTIQIEGSEEFREKTLVDFEKILTFPEGRELLESLYSSGQDIRLLEWEECRTAYSEETSETIITLSHKEFEYLGIENGKKAFSKSPHWISLAHELIHALHYAEDSIKHEKRRSSTEGIHELWGNKEEHETIGDPKNIPTISENAFRKRTILPLRKFHIDLTNNDSFIHKILNTLIYESDWDLKILLDQRPPISVELLNKIALTECVQKKQHTLKALLIHPHFDKIQTETLLESFHNRALKKGWVEIMGLLIKSNQTK